jgi:hypothetical protein
MLQEAVEQEIPRELGFLHGYDAAVAAIEAEFDLPQKEIALLVRMIQGNQGRLSKKKRPQFDRLPNEVISRIEQLVADAFGRV